MDFNREVEIAMVLLDTHGDTSYHPVKWHGWKYAETDYCPSWLESDLGDGEFVTVLDYSLTCEVSAPEGYERVYQCAAGEHDCPYCGSGTDSKQSPDPACLLCEGSGHVYQGEECQLVVFKKEEEVEEEFFEEEDEEDFDDHNSGNAAW
jgi:hypothetical protein